MYHCSTAATGVNKAATGSRDGKHPPRLLKSRGLSRILSQNYFWGAIGGVVRDWTRHVGYEIQSPTAMGLA